MVRDVRKVCHHLRQHWNEHNDTHHGEDGRQQQHDSLKRAGRALGDRALHGFPQSEADPRLYYVQFGAWIALIDTFDHWKRLYRRVERRQDDATIRGNST
jgi:hypothetical protein